MITNVRYVAQGRLVLADIGAQTLEPVGMLDSAELATLAAIGMNQIMAKRRAHLLNPHTPDERLTPGVDFRDPHAQTQALPIVRGRHHE